MTPAIHTAKKAAIPFQIHQYDHDANTQAYGDEAVQKLGLDAQRVFKTLVLALENKQLAVAVLPVATQLDLKQFAKAVGVKKAALADKKIAEKTTGYVLGGISPLGQKKALLTVIDASAQHHLTIFVSAGRRGLEIELTAADLAQLTAARFAEIGKL